MSTELPKAYDPSHVEKRWYKDWIDAGCFRGEPREGCQPYCIVIPPPNVTGVLTMGHVLNNTIQDILIRRARQQGKAARWIPGTDHAGIATQARVEKALREQEGLSRHDLGRERFVEKAIDWRDQHGGLIIEQLKRLGCSCDWERNTHTLDEDYSRAVLHAFVKLYQRGYIYRGKRMVNWCPVSLTALSDEEVFMKPQEGEIVHLRYEVAEEPGTYLEIATTRAETIMGDTAVAVHPEDERYQAYIGKHVWRPFPREQIPIIADSAVEREFGTGVLKVTPAHDPLDFEIGQRHQLPIIDVLNPDGTMNELAGSEFTGMDRFDARKKATEQLRKLRLLVKQEHYSNNVGYSERANVPIEPRLSEQWFLRYPRVEDAKRAVSEGHIRFWPKRWEKNYLHWLENIQDWCISRQLWWGHRIPVWYRKEVPAEKRDYQNPEHVHISLNGPENPENWIQDEDVLDTWASSWLWPLATMGWPDEQQMQKHHLSAFYPTDVLVTGPDIIFFWVARMIIAGLEFYGETPPPEKPLESEEITKRIPFRNVYFTGIIRDIEGRKMSKSLGNSPDPIELIERYGADGLRYGILSIAPQGQDIRFSVDRVEQGRNFCNKLWNACRFRQMYPSDRNQASTSSNPGTLNEVIERMDPAQLDSTDHAILLQLCETTRLVEHYLQQYEMNQATQVLYTFFWSDFCDWYVEISKARLKHEHTRETVLAVQDLCLRQLLQLLHPYTPFITEELWHAMHYGDGSTYLQDVSLPTAEELRTSLKERGVFLQEQALNSTMRMRDLVSKARALKAQYQLANKQDVNLSLKTGETDRALLEMHHDKLCRLVGAARIDAIQDHRQDNPGSVTEMGTVYLDLATSVDAEAERERIQKEIEKLQQHIASSEKKLNNANFLEKAPADVVEGARTQLRENRAKLQEQQKLLDALLK